MPRNDFSSLKTRVLGELHDNSLSTKVGDFVLETINTIHNRTDHKFLKASDTLTTVASQQEYSIATDVASDVDKIISIVSRDPEYYLDERNKQDLLARDPDITNEETDPYIYYVQDDVLGLYPVPNAAKTLYVDYIKFAADLTADDDVSDIPLRWTQVIIDGAVFRGLKWLRPGAPQIWTPQEGLFEKGLAQMTALNQAKPNEKLRFKAAGQSASVPLGPRIPNWKS